MMTQSQNEGKALSHLARTEMLVGTASLEKFRQMRVAVFGVGGVGGYVIEALARTGIGAIDLIDNDTVSESNLNRQIIATRKTLGKPKVEVFSERIKNIDSGIQVNTYELFYLPDSNNNIPFEKFDYIVDAVDTVSAKIDLVIQAEKQGIPIISAMGCGNRLDPGKLVCTDIYKTEMDPLAKVLRKELRSRGIKKLKVVYSKEMPIKPMSASVSIEEGKSGTFNNMAGSMDKYLEDGNKHGKSVPGSSIFVPAAAGLLIASEVFRELLDL